MLIFFILALHQVMELWPEQNLQLRFDTDPIDKEFPPLLSDLHPLFAVYVQTVKDVLQPVQLLLDLLLSAGCHAFGTFGRIFS